jgi:hypothetical protein
MGVQSVVNSIQFRSDKQKNDKIYTPKPVANMMIEMCNFKEGETVLDPCKGGGIFYDNLPSIVNKEWCELDENKSFYDWNKRVDCVIGNPPFSEWTKWLDHTINITDKFCYIFGCLNLTPSRIEHLYNEGWGLTQMKMISIEWWFGHQYLCLFEKNKDTIIDVAIPHRVYCDICDSNCRRGRKKLKSEGEGRWGMNECSKQN